MKKRHQILLIVVSLAAVSLAALWFQANRLLPSQKVQEVLVQRVQAITEGTLSCQKFQVGYFPQPRVVLEQAKLTFPGSPLVIEADRFRFDVNILPLLIGRVEPSAVYALGGMSEIPLSLLPLPGSVIGGTGSVKLENFSLKMGAVRPNIPIPLQFTSGVGGKPDALVVKGHLMVDSLKKWSWEKTSGHLAVELKDIVLHHVSREPSYDPRRSVFFKDGEIRTTLEITKKIREPFVELSAEGSGKGLAYEVLQDKTWTAPPSFDAEWNMTGAWNHDTEELKVHKMKVKSPIGNIEANGAVKLGTGEISGIHFAVSDMVLEDLLKYCPAIEKAIPFHIGFSGPSKWVVSADGTLDHLSIHLDWDLTKVLLTYGQYFLKPKDIPLNVSFDYLVQKGATLSGDFAVKFEKMSLKGNLKDLDLATGNGQLNLLTNKFSMNGWEQYIPALQQYKIQGDAKLLANWKGDLRKLEKAEHIFNVTIEKGSLVVSDGKGIHNATLAFDYSPMMLEGRQMKFDIGNSSVVADLKIWGGAEDRQTEVRVVSLELKPREAWQAVVGLCRSKAPEAGAAPDLYDQVANSIEVLFPQDQALKDFSTSVRYRGKKWDVSELVFTAYQGQVALRGMMDFADKEPQYRCDGEVKGLDLGLYTGRKDTNTKVLDGNLTLQGFLEGRGWGKEAWGKSLGGEGSFSLVNGKFQTFDLKDTLATMEPFSAIGEVVPSIRDFDAMDFHWKLSGGKIFTEDLLVKQKDYVMDAEGTLDLEGLANFRSEVYLSTALAARLFPKMASAFNKETKAHFGPISVLLSGPLAAPAVKFDPIQGETLSDKIRRKKAKELLYELVLE
ncbi:MAG TPA: AsmA-like C-terminal region-containing protein [Candidatus Omnitrophota bacterium]|nr:AsmA-like C-terminal region-containing protein [Candidatus Omnitrophota bacterium]HPS36437.1 AsmA-like C-terminal region-containing protein [Candidatus Omnitrophota bacterium]